MPELNSEILEKIDELRTISQNWGDPIEVYELLKISWAQPTGSVYYAATQVDELSPTLPVGPVVARVIHDGASFFEVSTTAALSDDEIDLKMWDADGVFSDLVEENGEGVRCELFLWFPAVELLLSVWWGHLRTGEECDQEFWQGKIATGFRSPNLNLPRRAHFQTCQAIYGKLLETQAEIDQSGCPHNAHLPGGTVGNNLHATCPRKTKQNCIDRGIDPLYHLSHQSVKESVVNYQTKGPNLLATSRGNETNLKRPVRVVMGTRRVRDMDMLASTPQYNNNNPDRGFWRVMYEMCEGPIHQIHFLAVNGQNCLTPANAIHLNTRYGYPGQARTSFSPNSHNYSNTAVFSYVYGWVNPNTVKAEDLKAEGIITGLNSIKQFSDPDTYTQSATNDRAWQIFKMLTDRRWGYALDESRIHIPAFIECSGWSREEVEFVEPETGEVLRHTRSISDVDLQERTTQQQIEDMCWAGRFSRPFIFQGKLYIVPLRALTLDELDECPTFTDEGDERNIIVEKSAGGVDKSTLTRKKKSDGDSDFFNRLELAFDDWEKEHKEQVISVEDQDQQLSAGRIMGDTTLRVVPKKESALGVVVRNQAIKLAWSVLDLGKFDEGGLRNNLEIKFKAWFLDCLELHEYKVIRVTSSQLDRHGFEWFRIKKISRLPNLQVEIIAQAYNAEYMNEFEAGSEDPPIIYFPDLPNGVIPLEFGETVVADGYLEVEIVAGS